VPAYKPIQSMRTLQGAFHCFWKNDTSVVALVFMVNNEVIVLWLQKQEVSRDGTILLLHIIIK
jgi:hypothetical protein